MKYLCLIIFNLLFLAYLTQSKDFNIQIDDAYFYDLDSNKYRWEFYYSFEDKDLKFVKKDNYYLGELFINVSISKNNKVLSSKRWIVSHKIEEINQEVPFILIGEKDFFLVPGNYDVSVYVQDFYDSTSFSDFNFDIRIPDFNDKQIFSSSLELSTMISGINSSHIKWSETFIKDTLYVVPMPSRILDGKNQSLYIYFEIYKFLINNVKYNVSYEIKNTYEEIVYSNQITYEGSQRKIVCSKNIPIFNLSSGKYFLNIEITNNTNVLDTIKLAKEIFIINLENLNNKRRRLVENKDFENSEFATLTPKQTDIELRKIRVIATDEELDKISLLTETVAKQRMLYNFWKIRDNDTTDNFNEALFNFKKLIKFAEDNFTYGNIPGWETDRGRIVLKYGIPGQRLINPQKGDLNAYETWFYEDLQGGIYFYFVDLTGYGNFILVHSTAFGEIQYDDWFNEYVVRNNRYHNDLDNNKR